MDESKMNLPDLNDGEVNAGLCFVDGKFSHWLILLPATTDETLTWKEANCWAAKVAAFAGGNLPTRDESALLYANARDEIEEGYCYWTATEVAYEPSYAWVQDFIGGNQGFIPKDNHFSARAVRRVPFEEGK